MRGVAVIACGFLAVGCATAAQSNGDDDDTVDAAGLADAPFGVIDAPPGTPDAPPGTPDAPPGTIDAPPGTPDAAPLPIDAPPAPIDAAPPMIDAAPGVCTENSTLSCNVLNSGSLFLADESVSGEACSTLDTTQRDDIWRFVAPSSGTVTATLDVIDDEFIVGDDIDLYVLTPSCDPATCLAYGASLGDESFSFSVTSGQTYYLVVELYSTGLLTFQNYNLTVSCP